MNGSRITPWLQSRQASGEASAAGLPPEQPVVRLFRGLRRLGQLRRMIAQGVRNLVTAGTARSRTLAPANYQLLANAPELPDRPMPLSQFERAAPGEATMIERMARRAAAAVVTNYCAMKVAAPAVHAMRDQHAKSHGCVRAEFVVRDDLPPEFTTSLFRPGVRYPTLVRFSNGDGRPRSDRKLDGRGMSIKLRGVDTATFLRALAPDRTGAGEHDFVLGSFPVFFCKDVSDYSEFMEAVDAPHTSWPEWLSFIARWFVFIVRHPRQFFTFLRIGLESLATIRDPLAATYHSMSPYLFGEDKVVRYVVSPARRRHQPARWQSLLDLPRSDNFLRDALVSGLDPATHPSGDDVAFDFSIRVRHSATPGDAEDASRWWTAPRDQTVQLGRIEIPMQDFLAPDQLFDCEHMMFNPWNCLPQHRPLGSLNRMRLAVYLAALQVRHKLNRVAS
jgi:hypothetical protein